MSYIGVLIAVFYLYVGFKVTILHRDPTAHAFKWPFGPAYMGAIFGLSLIVVCIGPFALFGSWPAISVLVVIELASVLLLVIYYWAPLAKFVLSKDQAKNIQVI